MDTQIMQIRWFVYLTMKKRFVSTLLFGTNLSSLLYVAAAISLIL